MKTLKENIRDIRPDSSLLKNNPSDHIKRMKANIQKVKDLLKTELQPKEKTLIPGSFLIYKYNAKNDEEVYDKTPLVFVLKVSKSYVLGLNFHYCPIKLRKIMIKFLFKVFKNNFKLLQNNKHLEFSYERFKPILHRLGMFPVIRLYIRKRISPKVCLIPSNKILDIALLSTETFTGNPRITDKVLYKKAIAKYKSKSK